MNQQATLWDEVGWVENCQLMDVNTDIGQHEFMDRDQPVPGDEDDCTAEPPSRGPTTTATMVLGTVNTETGVPGTVRGGEVVHGLFD